MLKDFYDDTTEPIVKIEEFYGEQKHIGRPVLRSSSCLDLVAALILNRPQENSSSLRKVTEAKGLHIITLRQLTILTLKGVTNMD